jgi:SPP1 gp7 family putative phage head morphogenesis protein
VQAILEGVAQGFNPRKIAEEIQGAFGGGLTDALRNTRTVQLYAYRDSARANYMASDGIVTGWVWFAELDADVCEACAAEHGSIHDLDETLDGHYNCRCAALPYIEGLTGDISSGEDWFNGLSESDQAAWMGPGKYDAWQQGKFEFGDLSKVVPNDVFGPMTVPSTLGELVGE